METRRPVYRLTESAVMLAVASVLSVLKLVDLPYGGSITAFSMLPLLLIAYRYGTRWGLLTGFTYGLIQLLLGMDNLSYATSFTAAVAILLLDYVLAFTVLGLGGLFRRWIPSQSGALCTAAVVTGVLRWLCHVISGCTVWAGLAVPTNEALIYSLSYNACYMLPEVLLLVLGALYLSRVLSFSGQTIARAEAHRTVSPLCTVLSLLGKTGLLAAAVADVMLIAPKLQFSDGTLFLAGLQQVDWTTAGLIALGGVLLYALLTVLSRSLSRRNSQ